MEITERTNGDVVILAVSGTIRGGSDIDTFRGKVKEVLDQGKRKILFDMAEVEWISSTGIGIIVASLTSIAKAGGTARFLNVRERVKNTLTVTRLLPAFGCFDGEEEAMESFQ